jgi:thioredoxin reductase (NADPH)
MDKNHFDVIVVGGGPSGLTAGIYLSRAKMKTLILNEGAAGGQLILTHEIANYPGVEAVSGYMLANTMKKQAKSFGCKLKSNLSITACEMEGDTKRVEVNGKDVYTADALILATGGKSRPLGVAGEQKLRGKGISYCATCDGDFFQDKNIIVVGGGNTALEEAVSLTKYASSVEVVHMLDEWQAFEHYVAEAEANPKISFTMNTRITEFFGDEKLQKVTLENLKTGESYEKEIDGVFVFIGYIPNTESLEGKLELNERKEIVVDEDMHTSLPGVFAAGDSIAKKYRQVTTAVADGTIAALAAAEYVNARRKNL